MEMLSLLGVCYEYFSGFCIHPWNAHGLQRDVGQGVLLLFMKFLLCSIRVCSLHCVSNFWGS